jgi:hypothetical protein
VPRLAECFEASWATDWVLKRLIDQRVADVKRARVEGVGEKRKRKAGKQLEKGSKKEPMEKPHGTSRS